MTGNGANYVDFNTIADKVDFSDMGDEFLTGYCTMDGKILGLPTGLNAVAMFQNRHAEGVRRGDPRDLDLGKHDSRRQDPARGQPREVPALP